jgi:hypothetical protein
MPNRKPKSTTIRIESVSPGSNFTEAPGSPVLVFPETRSGVPIYSILTVGGDAPLTLRTDHPAVFQLASDATPQFVTFLTLSPPPHGAHVHVRYAPTTPGPHHGLLHIEGASQHRTVELRGAGLNRLPVAIRVPQLPVRALQSRRWGTLLVSLLLGGLIATGYAYRCTLLPAWCEAPAVASETKRKPSLVEALPARPPARALAPKQPIARTIRRTPTRTTTEAPKLVTASKPTQPTRAYTPADLEPQPKPIQPVVLQPNQDEGVAVRPRSRGAAEPVPPKPTSEVSELERILNARPNPL